MIVTIAILVPGLVIFSLLLLHALWPGNGTREGVRLEGKKPSSVSVLIAARNEEGQIGACLDAVSQQSFAREQEILLGDDDSEDSTYEIAKSREAGSEKLVVRHFDFKGQFTVNPKARVLARLARVSKGEILFFTDADILVNHRWIDEHLDFWPKDSVISIGAMRVLGDNLFARLQNYDMSFAQGMMWVLGRVDQPHSLMGNNMAITKEAYELVGGFEGIPKTVTEDFEIYRQLRKKGMRGHLNYGPFSIVGSRPEESMIDLLWQRRRWMQGAIQMPLWIVIILSLNAFYYPLLIILFFFSPLLAVILGLTKILLQAGIIERFHLLTGQSPPRSTHLLFEVYACMLSISLGIFFLLPLKHLWKGRKLDR